MIQSENLPSLFSVFPFLLLLGMIATGPVLYPHFWHRAYTFIAIGLGSIVVGYYVFVLGNTQKPIEAFAEYVQFIALIAALYMVSGTILIKIRCTSKPLNNLRVLWLGATLANFIGTTGASMLLIRPYMRLNRHRLAPYHIVFFIFMVSNVGGALTPIGDPPLFLGFLKGIPFSWPLKHNFLAWLVGLTLVSSGFYWFDRANPLTDIQASKPPKTLNIHGKRFLPLFAIIIGSVFLDPDKITWLPHIPYHGHRFSFVRELILLSVIAFVYIKGNKKILQENQFSLAPLKEVAFIFIGIFATMMPALTLIEHMAQKKAAWIDENTLYWATGILSSVLDNAPTYLSFLAAGMSAKGLNIDLLSDVATYTQAHVGALSATSLAAVFFGAMTYVGNGPNFMVRAIAEEQGVKMPSFGSYIWHYALRFLLPALFVIWVLFINNPFA